MRRIRRKGGGHIIVLGDGDVCPAGDVCFSEEEWKLTIKLGKDLSDPAAESEFWRTIIDKKESDGSYNLLKDFPDVVINKSVVPTREFAGKAICLDTIEMLRGRVVKVEQ